MKARFGNVVRQWSGQTVWACPVPAAVLTYPNSRNHYHSLFDVVARVQILKTAGIKAERYIVGGELPTHCRELLTLLGIPESKRIYTRHKQLISAPKLFVPSLLHWSNGFGWAVRFLQELIRPKLERYGPLQPVRLYLTRNDARTRRVKNENELMLLLGRFGFRRYSLKGMSFDEQLNLFASAEAIIAPHGAGIANIIACKPGTKLFELVSESCKYRLYWKISSECGMDHYHLLGEQVNQDMRVSLNDMRSLLLKAGIQP